MDKTKFLEHLNRRLSFLDDKIYDLEKEGLDLLVDKYVVERTTLLSLFHMIKCGDFD